MLRFPTDADRACIVTQVLRPESATGENVYVPLADLMADYRARGVRFLRIHWNERIPVWLVLLDRLYWIADCETDLRELGYGAEVPVPHPVGTRLFFARADMRTIRERCPDCLGTRKWTWTTPAGTTGTAACGRCLAAGTLPRNVTKAEVDERVVTGFQLDVLSEGADCAIEYRSRSGENSNYILPSWRCFTNEADATRMARELLRAQEARSPYASPPREVSAPRRLDTEEIAAMSDELTTLKDEHFDLCQAIYHSPDLTQDVTRELLSKSKYGLSLLEE